jgi:hypothetical protein
MQHAANVTKAHGRREKRTIHTTTLLNEYRSDWPNLQQVYWIRRETTVGGKSTVEDEYGITSAPPRKCDATALLVLRRAHWAIENTLQYRRDVTLGEDACRARKGSTPIILAAIRNAALTLLDGLGLASAAAATRHCMFRPVRALRLIFKANEN